MMSFTDVFLRTCYSVDYSSKKNGRLRRMVVLLKPEGNKPDAKFWGQLPNPIRLDNLGKALLVRYLRDTTGRVEPC